MAGNSKHSRANVLRRSIYIYTPPNGESWQSFETRLIKTLSGLLEKHPNEAIVIVSHGGAIRALMPYLLGIGKEESFKHNPDNASITVFDHDEQVFSQQLANDTSHLK
jgi:broad specificity phosphatase PhoE